MRCRVVGSAIGIGLASSLCVASAPVCLGVSIGASALGAGVVGGIGSGLAGGTGDENAKNAVLAAVGGAAVPVVGVVRGGFAKFISMFR